LKKLSSKLISEEEIRDADQSIRNMSAIGIFIESSRVEDETNRKARRLQNIAEIIRPEEYGTDHVNFMKSWNYKLGVPAEEDVYGQEKLVLLYHLQVVRELAHEVDSEETEVHLDDSDLIETEVFISPDTFGIEPIYCGIVNDQAISEVPDENSHE